MIKITHEKGYPSVWVTADTSDEEIATYRVMVSLLEQVLARHNIPNPLTEELYPVIAQKAGSIAQNVVHAKAAIAATMKLHGDPLVRRVK